MHDRISILHKMYFFAKKCMYVPVLFSVNEFLTKAIEPCKKFPPKSYILLKFLVYVTVCRVKYPNIFYIYYYKRIFFLNCVNEIL